MCHWSHTYGDLLFSYRGAVMQHQSTAALVRAEKLPHCSLLLCKTGPQHACATAVTPMEICSSYRGAVMQHQSTAALAGQKRLPTVHCCSAKQADSMLMPLESHLWRFALHTGVQSCNTKALQHWSGQKSFPTVQCCSAKQAHSKHVALESHLWRFALFIQGCSDAAPKHCSTGRAEKTPHCSLLLCKTG